MNVNLKETYGLYIDGKFVPASDGATFETTNPANGEHLAYCAEATKEDVDYIETESVLLKNTEPAEEPEEEEEE